MLEVIIAIRRNDLSLLNERKRKSNLPDSLVVDSTCFNSVATVSIANVKIITFASFVKFIQIISRLILSLFYTFNRGILLFEIKVNVSAHTFHFINKDEFS